MIGRGLIANPGMLTAQGTTNEKLEKFMDDLLVHYTEAFGGVRNAMFRMKENWGLILPHFQGSEKLGKQLRKTTDIHEYRAIAAQIFHTLSFTE